MPIVAESEPRPKKTKPFRQSERISPRVVEDTSCKSVRFLVALLEKFISLAVLKARPIK